MAGWESWRFHAKDSAKKGPCRRRRWCLACWVNRMASKVGEWV